MIKTQYGMYALFDSELGCFIPESLAICLNDRQAVQMYLFGLAKGDPRKVAEILPHRRFYRVGFFEIDKLPENAAEVTNEVLAAYQKYLEGVVKKDVSDEVQTESV